MAKFNLAADKLILVGGVLVSIKAGQHETNDEATIKALRGAKQVTELAQPKTSKNKAAD